MGASVWRRACDGRVGGWEWAAAGAGRSALRRCAPPFPTFTHPSNPFPHLLRCSAYLIASKCLGAKAQITTSLSRALKAFQQRQARHLPTGERAGRACQPSHACCDTAWCLPGDWGRRGPNSRPVGGRAKVPEREAVLRPGRLAAPAAPSSFGLLSVPAGAAHAARKAPTLTSSRTAASTTTVGMPSLTSLPHPYCPASLPGAHGP